MPAKLVPTLLDRCVIPSKAAPYEPWKPSPPALSHSFILLRGDLSNDHDWQSMEREKHFLSISARAELDGNLPRVPHPLTIVQVKNPERNADDGRGQWWCTTRLTRRRKGVYAAMSVVAAALALLALAWPSSSSTSTTPTCPECAPELRTQALIAGGNNEAAGSWTRVFNDVGKNANI